MNNRYKPYLEFSRSLSGGNKAKDKPMETNLLQGWERRWLVFFSCYQLYDVSLTLHTSQDLTGKEREIESQVLEARGYQNPHVHSIREIL